MGRGRAGWQRARQVVVWATRAQALAWQAVEHAGTSLHCLLVRAWITEAPPRMSMAHTMMSGGKGEHRRQG